MQCGIPEATVGDEMRHKELSARLHRLATTKLQEMLTQATRPGTYCTVGVVVTIENGYAVRIAATNSESFKS